MASPSNADAAMTPQKQASPSTDFSSYQEEYGENCQVLGDVMLQSSDCDSTPQGSACRSESSASEFSPVPIVRLSSSGDRREVHQNDERNLPDESMEAEQDSSMDDQQASRGGFARAHIVLSSSSPAQRQHAEDSPPLIPVNPPIDEPPSVGAKVVESSCSSDEDQESTPPPLVFLRLPLESRGRFAMDPSSDGEEESQSLGLSVDNFSAKHQEGAMDHLTEDEDSQPTTLDGFAAKGQPGTTDQYNSQEYCVEDAVMLYDNDPETLQPLKPHGPIPLPPNTGHCTWEWQDEYRYVIKATFLPSAEGRAPTPHPDDVEYLFMLYDSTHVTVVLKNVLPSYDKDLWRIDRIADSLKDDYHHRFRRYDLNETTRRFEEVDETLAMRVTQYLELLVRQGDVVKQIEGADPMFEIDPPAEPGKRGGPISIDLRKTKLYMIDYDLPRYLPLHNHDFEDNFLIKDILPGGKRCMMNGIHKEGQPFMGPNLYVTPAASYTQFHQDGNGTVDSCHVCLMGTNEVVILRRLPEAHKLNALKLLGVKNPKEYLYHEPHSDKLNKPEWPKVGQIEECRKMGYCPAVLSLEPGECLLISKGALHAFRKMPKLRLSPDSSDCHAKLRRAVLDRQGANFQNLCVSVAWDWSFLGSKSEGINREVTTALECAGLNEMRCLQALAITQTMVLLNAKLHVPREKAKMGDENTLIGFPSAEPARSSVQWKPESLEILLGLLPALEYIVETQNEFGMKGCAAATSSSDIVTGPTPDAWDNLAVSKIDPYGNGAYKCANCYAELPNAYFHCLGCEELLESDFNICLDCHQQERYAKFERIHRSSTDEISSLNHCGHFPKQRTRGCSCKKNRRAIACDRCNKCSSCSCECHSKFQLRYRFFTLEYLNKLLQSVREAVGGYEVPYAMEARKRLRRVRERVEASTKLRRDDTLASVSPSPQKATAEKQSPTTAIAPGSPSAPKGEKPPSLKIERSSTAKKPPETPVSETPGGPRDSRSATCVSMTTVASMPTAKAQFSLNPEAKGQRKRMSSPNSIDGNCLPGGAEVLSKRRRPIGNGSIFSAEENTGEDKLVTGGSDAIHG